MIIWTFSHRWTVSNIKSVPFGHKWTKSAPVITINNPVATLMSIFINLETKQITIPGLLNVIPGALILLLCQNSTLLCYWQFTYDFSWSWQKVNFDMTHSLFFCWVATLLCIHAFILAFTVTVCLTLQSPHQNIDSYLNIKVTLEIDSSRQEGLPSR